MLDQNYSKYYNKGVFLKWNTIFVNNLWIRILSYPNEKGFVKVEIFRWWLCQKFPPAVRATVETDNIIPAK